MSVVTIRNNFIRCHDGAWVNLDFIGEFWIEKDKCHEQFYLKIRFYGDDDSQRMAYQSCEFQVEIFDSKEKAQNALDELMGIRVEDFTPIYEYEFSMRTQHALRMLACKTMGDARKIRRIEWQETRGVSNKYWDELQNVLDKVYRRDEGTGFLHSP